MDSLEDNIFLQAALYGEFTVPSQCSGHENNGKDKKTKQVQPRKKVPNRKYSDVEDTMIMRGIEACRREWRSVLQFMKDHADILGEAGTVYKMARSDDKLNARQVEEESQQDYAEPKIGRKVSRVVTHVTSRTRSSRRRLTTKLILFLYLLSFSDLNTTFFFPGTFAESTFPL